MHTTIAESASPGQPRRRRDRTLRWLWRLLSLALFALIAALLVAKARDVDWSAVMLALRNYEAATLIVAALFVAGGHAAAACYDLLGKRYVGQALGDRHVVPINFVAYAFSINFGALLGGWGLRFRLYNRYGVKLREIARIIGLAFVTNWSGFVLLSALALLWPLDLPADLPVVQTAWRYAASALLSGIVIAYLLICAIGHRRGWQIRLRHLTLPVPALRIALLQLALSCTSWLLMVATLDRLLPEQVPFLKVLVILFLGSLVGAVTHVPGSVGVLEASVTWLFGAQAEALNVLAAVLAYRVLYYFVPLLVAAIVLATMEGLARRHRARAAR